MFTSMERIIDVLEGSFDQLCDDCLSQLADVKPRQQVNMICRGLASAGKLQRQKVLCPECGNKKILNKLIIQAGTLPHVYIAKSTVHETAVQYSCDPREQAAKLNSIRQDLIMICNELDPEQETDPREKQMRSFGEKLNKLGDSGIIPNNTFIVMRMLNAMRNSVVYRGCFLNNQDQELINKAHLNVLEWWKTKQHSLRPK